MKTKKQIIDMCEKIKSDIREQEEVLYKRQNCDAQFLKDTSRYIDLLKVQLRTLSWAASND